MSLLEPGERAPFEPDSPGHSNGRVGELLQRPSDGLREQPPLGGCCDKPGDYIRAWALAQDFLSDGVQQGLPMPCLSRLGAFRLAVMFPVELGQHLIAGVDELEPGTHFIKQPEPATMSLLVGLRQIER